MNFKRSFSYTEHIMNIIGFIHWLSFLCTEELITPALIILEIVTLHELLYSRKHLEVS